MCDDDEPFSIGGTLIIDFGGDADVAIIDLDADEVSDIPLVSTCPN